MEHRHTGTSAATEKSHHHSHAEGPGNQNKGISGATMKKVVKSSGDDLLDEIFATDKRDHESFILNEKDPPKDDRGFEALTGLGLGLGLGLEDRPPPSVNRSEVKACVLIYRRCTWIMTMYTCLLDYILLSFICWLLLIIIFMMMMMMMMMMMTYDLYDDV